MTDHAGSSAWRIAFALLSAAEQRERIRALARAGWSPGSLSKLTGWSPERVMQAIRSASANTTTGG